MVRYSCLLQYSLHRKPRSSLSGISYLIALFAVLFARLGWRRKLLTYHTRKTESECISRVCQHGAMALNECMR